MTLTIDLNAPMFVQKIGMAFNACPVYAQALIITGLVAIGLTLLYFILQTLASNIIFPAKGFALAPTFFKSKKLVQNPTVKTFHFGGNCAFRSDMKTKAQMGEMSEDTKILLNKMYENKSIEHVWVHPGSFGFASAMIRVMAHKIKREAQGQRICLSGFSLGGALALKVAAELKRQGTHVDVLHQQSFYSIGQVLTDAHHPVNEPASRRGLDGFLSFLGGWDLNAYDALITMLKKDEQLDNQAERSRIYVAGHKVDWVIGQHGLSSVIRSKNLNQQFSKNIKVFINEKGGRGPHGAEVFQTNERQWWTNLKP